MRTLTVKDQSGQAFEVDEDKVLQAEKDGFLPVVSNGQEEHRVSYNDLPAAENDGFKLVGPKPTATASALRKAAQGALFGFSDEIAGWTEKTGRRFGVKGAGGPLQDVQWTGAEPTSDPVELEKAYTEGRDAERERLRIDAETNPMVSGAAELGAAILSPANKVASGLSLAKGGALLGGLYGLGSSERESALGNIGDAALGAGTGAILGKGIDKLSKAVAPTSQALAQKISPALEKKNTKQIVEAADRLGIKVTPGMLDETGFVQRLEYTLANSPSLFGQAVQRNQKAVLDKLDDAVATATKDASSLSPFQIGEKFKSGLSAKIAEKSGPISQVFDEVAESTKYIPLSDISKERVLSKISKLPEYRLSGGSGKMGEFYSMLGRAENANDIKIISSQLNQEIRAATGKERSSLMALKDIVGRFEKNSIMRSAIQTAKEGGMRESTGRKIGNEIVSDLKDARSKYKDLAQELSQIAENSRLKFQGPSTFVDDLENITSERIQDKFLNTENLRQMQNIKDKFPEQFQLLREGKIKELAEASAKNMNDGDAGISVNKFISQVNKLNPESKQLLFGDEGVKLLSDIETIKRSMPKNFNPSGTGSQQKWYESVRANVADAFNYAQYKGASTNLGKKLAQKLETPDFTPLQKKLSGTIVKAQNPVVIGGANASSAGLKGIEKWIAIGQEKVIQTDSSLDPDFLNQIKDQKKFKDALIRAGEMKSGSNQLKQTVEQIKSSEEYKKFQKEKEKQAQSKEPDQAAAPKIKFPLVVQKDGYTAVVRNADELSEAKSEGWA